MKLIIFNDEHEIIDELKDLQDPEIYGRDEIRWVNGGVSGINHNYVIVEDDQNLEDLNEDEILEQYKFQNKMELAREFDRNRVLNFAKGIEEEQKAKFSEDIEAINNRKSKQEIIDFVHERRANRSGLNKPIPVEKGRKPIGPMDNVIDE